MFIGIVSLLIGTIIRFLKIATTAAITTAVQDTLGTEHQNRTERSVTGDNFLDLLAFVNFKVIFGK